MLRRASLLSIDALLVAAATVLAILLRDSFDPGQEKMVFLIPFVGISIAVLTIAFFPRRARSKPLAIQFARRLQTDYRLKHIGCACDICSHFRCQSA
jgi:hypothetical protein